MKNKFLGTVIVIVNFVLWSCNNDNAIDVSNEDVSNQKYDLGELPDIVADIEWPQDPKVTQQKSITTDAELQMAVATNGISVLVSAGVYNSINITCNDCEFIFENDAEIKGSVTFTGSRIHWKGGRITGGPVDQRGDGDVLIDNLHAITDNKINTFSGAPTGWNRVAIINSTLEVQKDDDDGGWAIYVQDKNDGTAFRGQNFIIANVRLESEAQNNRLQAIQNFIVVDSYFNSNLTSVNGLRMHHGNEDVYMRDVIIVGGNNSLNDGEVQLTNGIFERITRYNDVNNHFRNGIGTRTVNVTINDSQCYTSANSGVGKIPNLGVATGVNPPMKAWDNKTVPSSSHIGADH